MPPIRFQASFALAALLAAAPAAADHATALHPALLAPTAVACTDSDPGTLDFVTPVAATGESAFGAYAAPTLAPTVLVVIGHGSTHTVESWRHHMEWMTDTAHAEGVGLLAVSLEYSRLDSADALRTDMRVMVRNDGEHVDDEGTLPAPIPRARHWPQKVGGEDLIAATKRFQAECPTIQTTILLGVSMGVSMSGYAVSHLDLPADAGLFDYWVACEGVHDMLETYHEAKAADPTVAGWIEAETGGTPDQVPNEYEQRTNLLMVDAIEASGLERVVYLHAVYDGLVGYHQSRQMSDELELPFEFYTVTTRGEGPPGTTLPDHVPYPDELPDPVRPDRTLAGHAGEWDARTLLMRATRERVVALATEPLADCGEYHVEEGQSLPPGEPHPRPVFTPVATHDCSLGGPLLNASPNALDDSAETPVDSPVTIDVLANDSDPDGDPITTIAATPGQQGRTEVQPDGSVTYTPNEGFEGNDSFEYAVSDGFSGSDTATVFLPEPRRTALLGAGVVLLWGLAVARSRSGSSGGRTGRLGR